MIVLLWVATLMVACRSVSFESLYNKELKTSYGYEIYKYYHDTDFGQNDVKKFKGESLLFFAPWYSSTDAGALEVPISRSSSSGSSTTSRPATTTSRRRGSPTESR